MRKNIFLLAVKYFLALLVCLCLLGATASFYTGRVEDIPQWNGWAYLFFSVATHAVAGAIPALFASVVAALIHREVAKRYI